MKCHRSRFSKLKIQWDIQKMSTAYIHAERAIMQDPSLTQWSRVDEVTQSLTEAGWRIDPKTTEEMDAQTFFVMSSQMGMTDKDRKIAGLEKEIKELETMAEQLLKEEKYELLAEAKELWEIAKKRLRDLKSR